MCSVSNKDHTLKIFDIINFDMINIIKFEKDVSQSCIVKTRNNEIKIFLLEKDSNIIYEYNIEGEFVQKVILKQHENPIIIFSYNEKYNLCKKKIINK
jgi:peptidylprolyl isomerase domain and WD repeat-containing protein 1